MFYSPTLYVSINKRIQYLKEQWELQKLLNLKSYKFTYIHVEKLTLNKFKNGWTKLKYPYSTNTDINHQHYKGVLPFMKEKRD